MGLSRVIRSPEVAPNPWKKNGSPRSRAHDRKAQILTWSGQTVVAGGSFSSRTSPPQTLRRDSRRTCTLTGGLWRLVIILGISLTASAIARRRYI